MKPTITGKVYKYKNKPLCKHKLVENNGVITCLNCTIKAIKYLLPLPK